MKKLIYIISVMFLLLVNSCTNELEKTMEEGQLSFNSINASMADLPTSRAHLENNGKVVWNVNDQIGIFSDTQTVPILFTCSSVDDSKASFISNDKIIGSNFIAYYPYDNSHIEENILTYTLSSNTQYTEGTYFLQAPMIAKSNTNEFKFKHTCGIIRFTINGTKQIESLVLEGNNNEIIAGTGSIDLYAENPILTISTDAVDASKTITMSINNKNATIFYFILPETEFTNGISLTINYLDENNNRANIKKTTTNKFTLNRSVIKSFSSIHTDELIQEEQEEEVIYAALMAFYNATNGDNWINNTNWGSDKPFNEWYGVEMFNNSIYNLMLSDNNLVGEITNELNEFSELVNLSVGNNKLTAINISNNKKLKSITCQKNMINSLDLSKNTELEQLICSDNYLTELDLLKNPLMTVIWCNNNKLKELAITNCIKLESLICDNNLLTNLDICKCNEIIDIWCTENQITLLNVTNCTKLETLLCNNNKLTNLDITKCNELIDLKCYNNQIALLDVTNCTKLESLICSNNKLTFLDINKCNELTELWCDNNQIALLDVTNCTKLETLLCSNNKLASLDISKLHYLKSFNCMTNNLTELNVSSNTQLTSLLCAFNQLSTLDVSNNHDLEEFWCHQNNLSVLDLTNLTKLKSLWCGNYRSFEGNYLTKLDLSNNTALEEFSCYGMKLTSLNVANNVSMITLECSGNPIESLELNKNTQLKELWCHTTNLSTLDISNNLPLEWLTTTASPNLTTIYISPEQSFTYLKDDWTNFKYKDNIIFYESSDFSKDMEVKPLQTATIGKGIDIVLMGDAFSDRLVADGTYEKIMKSAMEAFFSIEPYKSHKEMFNIYAVTAVSKNEEYDYTTETAFSGFFGEGTEVGGNDQKVFEYALKAIDEERMNEALIMVMMNSTKYAGTCYSYSPTINGDYGKGVAISYFPIGADETALQQVLHHEAGGHGFAKLADEYAYKDYGEIPTDYVTLIKEQQTNWGWWKNVDFTSDLTSVRWSQLINDSRYANEYLGVYEGGLTYWTGVWRSTENSIMRYNTGGFNAPSREAIYYRMHKLAYGEDWQYDYEKFVEYDAVNRNSVKSRSSYTKEMPPLHKPVIIKNSWKNARNNVPVKSGSIYNKSSVGNKIRKTSSTSVPTKNAIYTYHTILPDNRRVIKTIDTSGISSEKYINK